MLRGLYAAASAMVAQIARQDVYANNLANVNSVGFRRGQTVLGQFPADLQTALGASGAASGGLAATGSGLDLTQGPLVSTDRPLDLALNGDAFFTIQTTQGQAFTRDGRFQLDAQKRLTTLQGNLVLGERGPITLPASDFTVLTDGLINCQGKPVDRLRLSVPTQPQALGNGLYSARGSVASKSSTVSQGSLEQANVNGVAEMGRMLSGYRLYEANATALRYQDETLSSLMKITQ